MIKVKESIDGMIRSVTYRILLSTKKRKKRKGKKFMGHIEKLCGIIEGWFFNKLWCVRGAMNMHRAYMANISWTNVIMQVSCMRSMAVMSPRPD